MTTDVVQDGPKGTWILAGPARETRQRQPGPGPGIVDAESYPEKTRRLRREVQRKATRVQVATKERDEDDENGDDEKD